MWKKLIYSGVTFIGSAYLISTKKHGLQSFFKKKKSSDDDDAYILLPEIPGRFDFEEESSWSLQNQSVIASYWKFLKQSKSHKQNVRHKAVKSLSELSTLDEWQCMVIAQASDSRTAIGLARTSGVNVSCFFPPPFREATKINLKYELLTLLLSLPSLNTDVCFHYLTKRADLIARQLLKEEADWKSEVSDSYKLYHSERRKKDEHAFYKLLLQALLNFSCLEVHRRILLEKRLPSFLLALKKQNENDTELHSLMAQILANFALDEKAVKTLHLTGWVGILASWSRSPLIEVSLPAAKALTNLDTDDFNHSFYDNGIYVLHPLFRQNRKNDYDADLIFLHGLLGSTFWTWRQHDSKKKSNGIDDKNANSDGSSADEKDNCLHPEYSFCWPKDWLATDFPDARIISVDYNTCISKWRAVCPEKEYKDNIDAKAKQLCEKLLLSKIGNRPIIWVAHSMGGILVKQILVQAADDERSSMNSIVKNTKGIIFFSVPHKGSDIANIFQSVPYIFQPSTDIGQLHKGSTKLSSLHERFKEIVEENKIPILSYGETKRSKWGLTTTMLVTRDSSDPGIGEYLELPVDHLSTCKPETSNSHVYSRLISFFKDNIPVKEYPEPDYELVNIFCLIL